MMKWIARHKASVTTLLLLVAAAALIVLRSANPAVTRATSKEVYYFDSLPQMVATSDVVMEGTVTSVGPGDVIEEGPGPEDGSVEYSRVYVEISDLHYVRGSLPLEVGDSVAIQQLARDGGKPIIRDNVEPSEEDEEGFYFLALSGIDTNGETPIPLFHRISSQGRYVIQPDDTLIGSNSENSLVQDLQTLTADELRAAIEEAKDDVASGEAQPLPPPVVCLPPEGCVGDVTSVVKVTAGALKNASSPKTVEFSCTALAAYAVATSTSISECYLEDRTGGFRDDAPAVEMPGNASVTSGSGRSQEAYSDDVWLCWKASAVFEDGAAADEDCHLESGL